MWPWCMQVFVCLQVCVLDFVLQYIVLLCVMVNSKTANPEPLRQSLNIISTKGDLELILFIFLNSNKKQR